jgi:GNAT superfamily N-acetyltransferase
LPSFQLCESTPIRDTDCVFRRITRPSRPRIRPATDADCLQIATVEHDAIVQAYSAFVPESKLATETLEDGAAAWWHVVNQTGVATDASTIVAEQAGRVVGIAHASQNSVRDDFGGGLHALFVHPDLHRQGIGGKLFDETLRWFANHGVSAAYVEVYQRNPFRQFYESRGGRFIDQFGVSAYGQTIQTVAYGWHGLVA